MKNGAPHGNPVNSTKNEGPAPRKSRKKRPEAEGTTAGKRRRKSNGSCVDFGLFCEALGNHFGSQNVSKNRVKFRGRFLKVQKLKKVAKKR